MVNKKIEDIDYMFGGINEVDERERYLIAKALSYCPDKIIEEITKNVFFFSSNKYSNAWQLKTENLKKFKSIIFLSHHLKKWKNKKLLKLFFMRLLITS